MNFKLYNSFSFHYYFIQFVHAYVVYSVKDISMHTYVSRFCCWWSYWWMNVLTMRFLFALIIKKMFVISSIDSKLEVIYVINYMIMLFMVGYVFGFELWKRVLFLLVWGEFLEIRKCCMCFSDRTVGPSVRSCFNLILLFILALFIYFWSWKRPKSLVLTKNSLNWKQIWNFFNFSEILPRNHPNHGGTYF
jgi:hypothetical protein